MQNVTVLKHHAVTTYVGTYPGIFNLAVERHVISFTPRRLCPARNNSWYPGSLKESQSQSGGTFWAFRR
jgi:hypothetical protein